MQISALVEETEVAAKTIRCYRRSAAIAASTAPVKWLSSVWRTGCGSPQTGGWRAALEAELKADLNLKRVEP